MANARSSEQVEVKPEGNSAGNRTMGTALIVEDHPEQADLVARIVRLRNYDPIVAEDGETGLRLAREHLPDVVLLDLMLPDINGFDVCRRLRTDRATMLVPVVMLTALNDVQHRVHGFRVGANAYLTKPYGVDDLFEAITLARAWRSSMDQRALQGEIHVELMSEINFLKDLNDFLMLVCQTTPLTNDQVIQLRQAVMEMAQNAIEWGNLHQSDLLVNITYRVYDDHLEIVVRDQGARLRSLELAARRCRWRPVFASRRTREARPSCGRVRPLDLSRHGR